MTSPPKLHFSHLGLCVTDMPSMEAFYTDFLGLTVTDRGEAAGMNLVFLSSDPGEHHQVVLADGRPAGLPPNEKNPFFGAVVNQVSFRVADIEELKALHGRLVEAKIDPVLPANHGISLSLYFPDPEGNIIECFADTEWFCTQPVMEPLDVTADSTDILESARALCEAGQNYSDLATWKISMREIMTG